MLFISYSHKNQKIAESLHQCMLEYGYQSNQVFKDNDMRNGIVAGCEWQEELVQNIKGARALIVLVSPEWLQSKWCFAELAFAKSSPHKTAIIPLIIEPISDNEWAKSGLDSYQKPKCFIAEADKIEEQIPRFVKEELLVNYPPTYPLQRHRESYPNSSEFRFRNYQDWGMDTNMQHSLVLNKEHQEIIDRIRNAIESQTGPMHIHIHGASGIGKTRLVYEALGRSDFSEKTIYYDSPQTLWGDPYFRQLSSLHSKDKAIIVVDDCLRGEHPAIATQASKGCDRLKLITIALTNSPIESRSFEPIEIKPLDKKSVSEIICSYLHPAANVAEFAGLCQGSARFAHLVGESLSKSRSILELPNREALLDKIIACGLEPQSEQAQKRITVARFISVFSSFGFKPPYQEDTESLSRFISSFHASIGLGDLLDAIHTLRERRILQGKTTLYFSTPILSWQLWGQWWGIYGSQFRIQNLLDLSPYLQEKIVDNWRQSPLSPGLSEIASSLVTDTGFRGPSVCSQQLKSVRQLLDAVSDVCPGVVVEAIWQIYNSWDRNTPGEEEFFSYLHEFTRVIARNIDSVDHFLICVRLLEVLSLSGIGDTRTAREVLARFFCVNTRKDEKYFPYQKAIRFLETSFEHGGIERKILLIGVCKSVMLSTQCDSLQAIQYIDLLWKYLNEELCAMPDSSEKTNLIEESFECIRGLFLHPGSHDKRLSTMEWIVSSSEENRALILRWVSRYLNNSSHGLSNPDVRKSLKEFF